MCSLKNLPTSLPLSAIHRTTSLDHWNMTAWRWEFFFLDGLLPWFEEVLDRSSLVPMLRCIRRRIRWWWWVVLGYGSRDELDVCHV
jgi:hypothetical protein